MNIIEFNKLGLKFIINPVAFNFLGFEIHWYGIIIATGFLIGILLTMRLADRYKVDKEVILDFILVTTPASIIGARIYYVLFSISDYKDDYLEVFKIWHGGLAIYGAILGGVIAVILYSKYRKVEILPLADIVAPSIILGQAIGRWGNFVNAEAYGGQTNLPWGMTIFENGIQKTVHPTFLYESVINIIIFVLILLFMRKKKNDGEVFFLYIGLYSLARIFIEGLRSDSLYLGIFRISQIVGIVLILVSITFFVSARMKKK